jgi:hypothetical protein
LLNFTLLQDPEIRKEVRELFVWAVYSLRMLMGLRSGMVPGGRIPTGNGQNVTEERKYDGEIRWVFSEKGKDKELLEELGWFVGRAHELVLTYRAEMRELVLTDAIQRAMILPATGLSSPPR